MSAAVTVADVQARVGGELNGLGATTVTSITHDSRAVVDGGLFACVVGAVADGHDFAPVAIEQGAGSLLVDRPLGLGVPEIVVPDVRAILGDASSVVFGDPSHDTAVVGVTGTSGKTSVTQMLASVLNHADIKTMAHGTLTGARTTPEAPDFQKGLRADVDAGAKAVAVEVSSHALSLGRVKGTSFAISAFTNLGHDHLDFHGTIEQYLEAKRLLFTPEYTRVAVVNADDPAGERILSGLSSEIEAVPYRLADAVELQGEGPISRFRFRGHEVVLRLAGRHNVMNALVVALCAERLGVDPADIADGLCRVDAPRGRFEFVSVGQKYHVAVDYAHKPDALAAVLDAARQIAGEHRVIVVFGCGGDRDREKRPMMGAVAAEAADVVIVTSDNPRGEAPNSIIDEIVVGIPESTSARVVVEEDRRTAIDIAVNETSPGDVVLIAGKGHEVTQVIGNQEIPFDDREIAVAAISAKERAS